MNLFPPRRHARHRIARPVPGTGRRRASRLLAVPVLVTVAVLTCVLPAQARAVPGPAACSRHDLAVALTPTRTPSGTGSRDGSAARAGRRSFSC